MQRDRWRGVLSRHPDLLGALFVLYWIAIFAATHIEMPRVPSSPRNTDKFVHFVMYAGFTFLFSFWLSARKSFSGPTIFFVAGAAIIYALVDELSQKLTATRTADVWDFGMDVMGALFGLSMFWVFHRKFAWLWVSEDRRIHGDDSKAGLY